MSETQLIGGLLDDSELREHPMAHAPVHPHAQAHAHLHPHATAKFGMPPSVAAHVFSEDHMARPTSAPPVVTHVFEAPAPVHHHHHHHHHQHTPQYDVDSAEAFRADPAYCKWYYSQNPRDPRLPPPIIRPQPHTAHAGLPSVGVHFKKDDPAAPGVVQSQFASAAAFESAYQKGLVAMIQDDFPRTPSPVYGREALSQQQQALAASAQQHLPSDPAQLAQAMQALSFQQHPAQGTPTPMAMNPMQAHPGQVPLAMMPPMSYAAAQTKMAPPMMAQPQQPGQQQGWAQARVPPGAPMMQPQQMDPQQAMGMAMQAPQYYHQAGAYPQAMMPQYGMVPMGYDGSQAPQGMYYGANPYDPQQSQHLHMHQRGMHDPSQHPQAHQHLHGSPADRPRKGGRRDRGHEDAPRTRLMEEFRSMKARRWEIQDLVGHMVEFSRDQEGSRLIQRKLESCSDAEKDLVFAEVYKEALGLMTDVFGNYVIQKLFEHGLPRHRKMLACVLKGNVLSLTLQTYGCRVIQKALEVIDEEDQTMVAGELDGHVLRCVLDQNGNHVIQKCIERIPPQNVLFIVQSFVGNVQNLAVHAYGCRVIQRILEYCEDHHEVISPILDEILDNVQVLARDQYGNYVVQHVLINGKPIYQAAIIERLRPDCMELAQHKFASNVVEKMFQYGTRDDRTAILADLLRPNADGTSALHVMMRDQYANYVVQKVIDMADDAQRRQIIEHIKPHIATLRRYTYGKHIIARIEKLTPPAGKGGPVGPPMP
jgi:hypothetical protein